VQTYIGRRLLSQAAIAGIGTISPSEASFGKPRRRRSPTATSVTSEQRVSIARAESTMNGALLRPGSRIDDLPLTEATLQRIATAYGRDVPLRRTTGVELVYGGPAAPGSAGSYVRLNESLEPQLLYGFGGAFVQPPPDGTLRVMRIDMHPGATLWRGQMMRAGVFATIEATSKRLLLSAARGLMRGRSK